MKNGVDAKNIIGFGSETHAIFADAKPQFAGISVELFDVSLARLGKAKDGGEYTHSSLAIQTPHVHSGVLGPRDLFHT